MNKIQVGATPSPNLKVVKSKIGSLQNATHKPGGGNVKIETKKVDIKAAPRIEAKNESYQPRGGDKKVRNISFISFFSCGCVFIWIGRLLHLDIFVVTNGLFV